jgi:hypothetical protein
MTNRLTEENMKSLREVLEYRIRNIFKKQSE